MDSIKIKNGFEGEKYICIPEPALKKLIRANPVMSQLYITYIGYFPKAAYHYRARNSGCKDNIFIYCTRGRGWFMLNDQRFEIGPNEFIVVPATKAKMSYGADQNDPWTIYWVHFSGSTIDTFNKSFNINLYDGAKQIMPNEKGIQLWESMYQNLEMGYNLENLTRTNLCLYHFLATFLYPAQYVNHKVQGEKDQIKDTIVFMQEHLNEKLVVDEIALKNELSSSHFSSLFKKATGMSPMDYFIHLKLQRACVLLYTSETKVKDIALTLGYNDPFHFSRLFKKNMNVSPNQYRVQRRIKEL